MIRRLALLHIFLLSSTALAQTAPSPLECAPVGQMHPLQMLRQRTLDLLGRIPTFEESKRIRDAADPNAELDLLLTEQLESDDFYTEIRRYHRNLMYASLHEIGRVSVHSYRRLRSKGGLYYIDALQKTYRGERVFCEDREQTDFDEHGRPIPNENGIEGWVEVSPYWAPNAKIKVCAFDAQSALKTQSNVSCELVSSSRDCGCGPNLRHCATDTVARKISEQLSLEPEHIFDDIVRSEQNYFDALRTNKSFVNGIGAHYYQYLQAPKDSFTGAGFERMSVPKLEYDDNTWTSFERPDHHQGVLTTPAFLLRFSSNRARANHVYSAFLCEPFTPPSGGIPADDGAPNPNLRQRKGCAACHQRLEPAAGHWSAWRTVDRFGPLDIGDFAIDDACICGGETGKRCPGYCNKYYVTADNSDEQTFESFGGRPVSAAYAADEELASMQLGPRGVWDKESTQIQLRECVVRNYATHVLGRPLDADDYDFVRYHAQLFADSGDNFKTMIHSILTSSKYATLR